MVVAQSCPTLCDSTDCGPPGSSVRGISQARILEWTVVSFSRASAIGILILQTRKLRQRVTCPRSHSQKRPGQGLSSWGGPGGHQGSGLLGLWLVCLLPRRRVGAEGEPGAESGPDNVPALGHCHPMWGPWSPPCAQTTARFLLIAAGGLWAQSGLHHAYGDSAEFIMPGHPVGWSSLAQAVMEPCSKLRAVAAGATYP